MVKANGKMLDISGETIAQFVASSGYNVARVAVELNGEIVSKDKYDKTVLTDGDTLEVVGFVGGG